MGSGRDGGASGPSLTTSVLRSRHPFPAVGVERCKGWEEGSEAKGGITGQGATSSQKCKRTNSP